jgi:hypothetical protein
LLVRKLTAALGAMSAGMPAQLFDEGSLRTRWEAVLELHQANAAGHSLVAKRDEAAPGLFIHGHRGN